MIIDRFRTWRPRPGALWRVAPTETAVDRVLRAPASPGPASFLQEDHLRAYAALRGTDRRHRAYTGTASRVAHPFDADALARALTRLARAQENLRCWFDLSGPDPVAHVAAPDDVAFAAHPEPDPDGPWPAVLHERMEAVFDAACRPDRWAPYALLAVDHGADGFSLAWGCDHAFTDGASQLMVLDDLADLYRDERGLTDAVRAPLIDDRPPPSFRAYAVAERERAAAADPDGPQITAWTDAVAAHDGRLPRSPLRLDLAPGQTGPALPMRVDLLDADGVRDLENRCRAAGSSVQAGVYAALAVATAELTGACDYYGVTVLGTRDTASARTFGWLCNFAPVAFAVAPGEPLSATLATATAALRQAKQIATVPVHAALGAMLQRGVTTPERLGSPQMLSYLDMRRFPGAGGQVYAEGVHYPGEGRTANTSMWVQRDDDGLYVVFQCPDLPGIPQRCTRFAEGVAAVLRHLAAGDETGSSGLARVRGTDAVR